VCRAGPVRVAVAAGKPPFCHRSRRTREGFLSNEHRDPGHAPCSMRGVSTPSAPACASRSYVYERRRPESATLHRVVRENLATLCAAVEQGCASPLPSFVKDELEGYLACGVLSRGFAILRCEVDKCDQCGARLRLRALLTAAANIERFLRYLGEPTELPPLSPARGPPFFKSRVLRRKLGELEGVAERQTQMFSS
jgi:hypothetical protein